MAQANARKTIWSLQYLRAIAAIAVVVYHQSQEYGYGLTKLMHGVDMFFVISGFMMYTLTHNRPITPSVFALDRIVRIAPSYWFATGLVVIIALLKWPFHNATADLSMLLKSLFFIPARNHIGKVQPTLYLGWTLAFEMFFYAVFAIVLFAKRHRLLLVSGVLLTLVAIGTVLRPADPIAETYTSPLLLEFLAGILLGEVFGIDLTYHSQSRQVQASAAIALAVAGFALLDGTLIYGALSVLIIAASLLCERSEKMPHIGWIKRLGDASFAIYLYQEFAFQAVNLLAAKSPIHWPRSLQHLGCVAAAIMLGLVFSKQVEARLSGFARSIVRRGSGLTARLTTQKPQQV